VALDTGCALEVLAAVWPAGAGSRVAALASRAHAAGARVVAVTRRVFDAMSPVRAPGQVAALAPRPRPVLDRMLALPSPLLVIACDVQDPGNVGAIVRAADACGATGVVCAGGCADPFGWKALRGAMGSSLRLPVVVLREVAEAIGALRARGLVALAATGAVGRPPWDLDWTRPTALLVGNEGAGLADAVVAAADSRVAIPMRAGVESLNVAVATGILLYEASRQRGDR
jgi:TrmH family RNA methyltransferase